jgi:hypothetical protein
MVERACPHGVVLVPLYHVRAVPALADHDLFVDARDGPGQNPVCRDHPDGGDLFDPVVSRQARRVRL